MKRGPRHSDCVAELLQAGHNISRPGSITLGSQTKTFKLLTEASRQSGSWEAFVRSAAAGHLCTGSHMLARVSHGLPRLSSRKCLTARKQNKSHWPWCSCCLALPISSVGLPFISEVPCFSNKSTMECLQTGAATTCFFVCGPLISRFVTNFFGGFELCLLVLISAALGNLVRRGALPCPAHGNSLKLRTQTIANMSREKLH